MEFFNKYEVEMTTFFIVAIIIISTAILSKVIRWLMERSFVTASEKLNVDPTRYKFFKNLFSFLLWVVALAVIVSLIPKLKALAITLFAGAGILVVIIGLAAQEAFSNIISGIFIVMFKPFRVGDLIKVGSQEYGVVEDITIRHTIINNFENKRIIMPNSLVGSEVIINDSIEETRICRWVEIGISYDSNVDLAIKIIQEEAEKHPYSIDPRGFKEIENNEPVVVVRLMSFGDSSVNLRASVWTNDPLKAIPLHSDINKAVKERFDKEGIEIPFPYRTVVYKNDLPKNT